MLANPVETNQELDAFTWFCESLILQQKRPMILEQFQKVMLFDHFAGATETVIITPKKNYKSTTIAALGLYHAMITDVADCIIVAQAVKQAQIIFQHMRGFINRSPMLQGHFDVKPGFNEIRTTRNDLGRIRVFAADEANLEGVEPTFGLYDEFGKAKSSEVYNILSDGLGTRGGQMVVISNAPADEISPLGELRSKIYDTAEVERDGAHRHYLSPNGQFSFHEWALDIEQDWTDLEIVKSANPANAQTIEELARRRDSPGMTDSRWKRMACGLIVPDGDSVIKPEEWDAIRWPSVEIPYHAPVWIGLDLSWRPSTSDTTAIVPLWWQSHSSRVIGDPIILDPQDKALLTPEGALDDRHIINALLDLKGKYTVIGIVYDPSQSAEHLGQTLSREHGFKMIKHSQKSTTLALADGRFMEAIRQKTLKHSGHKMLRYHALNAVEKKVGDAFMFDRLEHGPRKPTDALRAASMAHSVAFGEGGALKPAKPGRAHFF